MDPFNMFFDEFVGASDQGKKAAPAAAPKTSAAAFDLLSFDLLGSDPLPQPVTMAPQQVLIA